MLLYLQDNGSETESNKKFTFSMADRDDILLRFQEFTGIYDIEKCREILENHSWDLTAATNSYFEDFYSTEHPVQDPFETARQLKKKKTLLKTIRSLMTRESLITSKCCLIKNK